MALDADPWVVDVAARPIRQCGKDEADLAYRQLEDTGAELARLTGADLDQAPSALPQLAGAWAAAGGAVRAGRRRQVERGGRARAPEPRRGGLAWFLPAEDPALLDAEFTRLAGQLGVTDAVAPGDPVAGVPGALAAMAAPWILVFDNAVSESAVRHFLFGKAAIAADCRGTDSVSIPSGAFAAFSRRTRTAVKECG
jgi:hypothetical protein